MEITEDAIRNALRKILADDERAIEEWAEQDPHWPKVAAAIEALAESRREEPAK